MFSSRVLSTVRRSYTELDYARHFPKSYIERLKRTIPRKIYSNRLGAPDIIRWRRPPEDYSTTVERPWAQSQVTDALKREEIHHRQLLSMRVFKKRRNTSVKPIPAEEWTFFPGDLVEIMVGKDKHQQGRVLSVNKEVNAVFVDGLHTKLKDRVKDMERFGIDRVMTYEPESLFVDQGQVKLVDPNDNEPCTAKWVLNKDGTDYIRVSERTGYEIPLPAQAQVTYEYISPKDYIEVEGKDTKADDVLKKTYKPKLCTFEQEIEEAYGIKDNRVPKPTFWY